MKVAHSSFGTRPRQGHRQAIDSRSKDPRTVPFDANVAVYPRATWLKNTFPANRLSNQPAPNPSSRQAASGRWS